MEPIPFLSRSINVNQRVISKLTGEERTVREVGVVLTLDDGTNEFYSQDQKVLVVPSEPTEEPADTQLSKEST